MTWEDFDQLSSVYKSFGPYCSFPRQKWSALVNIRRKALLSSAGFRKRMTSPSPRGVYLPATHVYFCFDRPLWFVWWSDGLFRGLVLLFGSPLDWFNSICSSIVAHEDVDELLEALESLDSWIYSINLVGLNILLLHPLLSTALFQVLYAHSFGRF